jgi:hypothetical protein
VDLDMSSVSVTDDAAESMIPPPHLDTVPATPQRKKKARTLRESDWEPYKEKVIQLHLHEKRPLPEVKTLMEQEFGFTAEYVEQPVVPSLHRIQTNHAPRIRQYRSRLTQWKLDKNIKSDEMKAIIRHRQQRRLIETSKPALEFRVRGQDVEPQKIERWMKSHNVMESMLYAPSPAACKLI